MLLKKDLREYRQESGGGEMNVAQKCGTYFQISKGDNVAYLYLFMPL